MDVDCFNFFFSYTLLLFRILHVWCLDFIEILGFSLLPIVIFQFALGETSSDEMVAK